MVKAEVSIKGQWLIASVWINFREDGMYSKFTLEKGDVTIFEKDIDATRNGVEFFLEMYKSIELQGDTIIIKGRKDLTNLPMSIPLDLNRLPL